MRIVLFVILPVLFIANPSLARDWVRLPVGESDRFTLEIDKSSIVKHPGSISFRSLETVKGEAYGGEHANLLICSNGDIWEIGWKVLEKRDELKSAFELLPGAAGRREPEISRAYARHPLVRESCKRSAGKQELEVPIFDSTGESDFFLVHETKIITGLVSVWTRKRPTKEKVILDGAGNPIIYQGKELRRTVFLENSGDSLFNWVSDCKSETIALAAVYEYGPDRNVIKSFNDRRDQWIFQGTPPQSRGRRILEFSCGLR